MHQGKKAAALIQLKCCKCATIKPEHMYEKPEIYATVLVNLYERQSWNIPMPDNRT